MVERKLGKMICKHLKLHDSFGHVKYGRIVTRRIRILIVQGLPRKQLDFAAAATPQTQ